jgi:hypothetical protein
MRLQTIIITAIILSIAGCSNLSPRNRQNIKNNGDVGDIKNNQQGFMLEVGKLKQDTEIINSKLKEIQQGMININSALSRNENSGIQILQGDGSLILVFSLGVLSFIFFAKNRKNEKILKILTNKIVEQNNENLTNSIVDEMIKNNQGKDFVKILKC